jgi:hypothetical protein
MARAHCYLTFPSDRLGFHSTRNRLHSATCWEVKIPHQPHPLPSRSSRLHKYLQFLYDTAFLLRFIYPFISLCQLSSSEVPARLCTHSIHLTNSSGSCTLAPTCQRIVLAFPRLSYVTLCQRGIHMPARIFPRLTAHARNHFKP